MKRRKLIPPFIIENKLKVADFQIAFIKATKNKTFLLLPALLSIKLHSRKLQKKTFLLSCWSKMEIKEKKVKKQ